MLNLNPSFSLSSFTFIKRLFSSSSLSAIRVVSSAYLRLLILLLRNHINYVIQAVVQISKFFLSNPALDVIIVEFFVCVLFINFYWSIVASVSVLITK